MARTQRLTTAMFLIAVASVPALSREKPQGSPSPAPSSAPVVTPAPTPTPTAQWPKTLEKPAPAQTMWSADEIKAGRAACDALLVGSDVVAVPAQPIREGDCGAVAPVELISVGRNPQVTLSTPAIVTCDMAVALDRWMKADVQPAARDLLGAPVVRIEVMSSYSCRAAYGRKHNRMSEHGRANALDIGAFLTERGGGVSLLADWGPTERDARAQVAAAAAAAKAAEAKAEAIKRAAEKAATQPAPSVAQVPRPGNPAKDAPNASQPELRGPVGEPDVGSLASGVRSWRPGTSPAPTLTLTPPSQLGGPKTKDKGDPAHPAAQPAAPPPTAKTAAQPDATANASTPKARFLRRLHGSACRSFGTVLGPEANEAHRNHFHIDLAERKTRSYCE